MTFLRKLLEFIWEAVAIAIQIVLRAIAEAALDRTGAQQSPVTRT